MVNLLKNITSIVFITVLLSVESNAHGITVCQATGQPFQLYESHVSATIDNQISIVTSSQVFINSTGEKNKIRYAFPLSISANPISLRWRIDNGDWKEASVEASEQDDNIPGTTGNSGGGASNIDRYLGSNALHFRPKDQIAVDSKIEIEIMYVDLLTYSNGLVSFRYPNDYNLIQTTPLFTQSFALELLSDRRISEFRHLGPDPIILESNQNSVLYFYNTENESTLDDFRFEYELASDDLGIATLSTMTTADNPCDSLAKGFVSMIIEPESNNSVDIIEKNFTLVIDKSGSMNSANKMKQAREAASFIVNNLNTGDKFNIVSFNATVNSLFQEHQPYTEENKEIALEHITSMIASGSTNISGSLSEAISQFSAVDPRKANIIIFFTDGVATYGIKDTPELVNAIGDEVNTTETGIFLFTFGIGADVDQQLLTLLAIENKGVVNFLENENVEKEITDFFLKINNPVLIDIEFEVTPPIVSNLYPSIDRLPNLYKGEQLIISGRYEQAQDAVVKLKGSAFNLEVEYEFPITLSDSLDIEKTFLPKVWAKQQLDALTLDYYLESDETLSSAIKNKIDQLSICYNIVSIEFNSFTDNVLEIQLLSFGARVIKDQVKLDWSTSMEHNNDHFIIQRSKDGKAWNDIGKIEGHGTTSNISDYTFTDKTPYKGISYYRFKQVDLNGEYHYSEVRAVNFEGDIEVLIYPNPLVAGNQLNILSGSEDGLEVKILDIAGKVVHTQTISAGDTSIDIQYLDKGIYFIKVTNDSVSELRKIEIF